MALTAKMLKGLGLTDEQRESILEAHADTVNEIKAERDRLKSDAEKLADVQRQLEQAQSDLEAGKKDSYKVKYEALKDEFDTYKGEQAKKESRAAKETAYRTLLKEAGVNEKRIDAVLRVSDVDSVELDEKGAIVGADRLTESVKAEWADFIVTTTTQGAQTANPPANNSGKAAFDALPLSERMKYANEHPLEAAEWLKQ